MRRSSPRPAMRRCEEIVPKQIEAGIDIGNNGEQQREGFFLHVRHRMSGFGGTWKRWARGDVERYPALQEADAGAGRRPGGGQQLPAAQGDRRGPLSSTAPRPCRMRRFPRRRSTRSGSAFRRAVPHRALARHRRLGHAQRALRHARRPISTPSPRRCASSTRRSSATASCLQLDCPDLALERHVSYQDRPLGEFLGFVERVVATINKALVNIPRDRVRMHVCWGNYEGPHDCDVPLADILPIVKQMKVGGFVLPFANPPRPRIPACSRPCRSPTTRSSSPASSTC